MSFYLCNFSSRFSHFSIFINFCRNYELYILKSFQSLKNFTSLNLCSQKLECECTQIHAPLEIHQNKLRIQNTRRLHFHCKEYVYVYSLFIGLFISLSKLSGLYFVKFKCFSHVLEVHFFNVFNLIIKYKLLFIIETISLN